MNVEVVVEPALFLNKREEDVTKVKKTQHQGETHLREIQCQVKMESYTGTLSFMNAMFMDIFPNQ